MHKGTKAKGGQEWSGKARKQRETKGLRKIAKQKLRKATARETSLPRAATS